MKYLLTILFFLIAYVVNAQYIPNASAYSYKGLLSRESLQPPQGCGEPVTVTHAPDNSQAAFYWDSCADQLYTFSPKQQLWLTAQSGIDSIFITTSDSIFIITSNNDTIFIGTGNSGVDTAYQRGDSIFGVKAGIEFLIAVTGDDAPTGAMDTAYQRNDSIFGVKNNTEFFIAVATAGGGGSGGAFFNNIAAISAVNGDTVETAHVLGFYTPNDGGDGFFWWDAGNSDPPVTGMIIEVAGTSGRWKRIANGTYSLRWFGAKGIGIAGYQADSAALRQSLEYVRARGYGSIYVPASDSAYCYAGLGIVSPDNLNFYGDGMDKTKWLYVNMNYSPDYYNGTFLFFGTFATTPGANMTRTPRYEIFDVTKGQTTVKLRTIADAANFTKGELIKLASRAYNKGNEAGKTIWRCNSFHIITRISNDTLFLDHAAIMDIPRDDPAYALYEVTNGITSAADTGSAVIFRPNAGVTSNGHLGTDKMSVNVSVHDMSFDVSPFDYVNGTPYDSTIVRSPGNIFSLGSVYGLNLYNLRLNAFGNFGGQYYSNFNIQNLHVTSARKVFDFGNESSEGFLNGIFYRYKNEFYDTTDVAMVYINNHSHNIAIMNMNVTGAYAGRNAIQIDGGVHDIAMTNIRMDLPNFGTTTNDVIHVTTQDTVDYTYPVNITMTDIDILVHSARRYISWVGQPHTDWNYNGNIIFRNLTFRGFVDNNKPVFFDNADTIYAANILQPTFDSVHILNTTYLRNLFTAIGSGGGDRDLLPHSPGFGILGSDYDGTTRQIWAVDTSVLNGQIFIDSSNVEFFVDSIANAPLGTEATGTKYLVGTSPTGDFAGHPNEIAELTGAVWSFIVADTSDNLVVSNETQPTAFYHFDGTNWNLQRRSLSIGGDRIGARIDIGTIDNQRLRFITNGGYREEISNAGHFFRRYQGARSNNYLKIVDTATGRMDTASFTPLVLTTNGSSGASTLSNDTLNIPVYSSGGGGGGIGGVYAGNGLTKDNDSTLSLTTPVAISNGGTNNSSLSVTNGTIYYGDGSKLVGLAPGDNGNILGLASGLPTWSAPNYADSAIHYIYGRALETYNDKLFLIDTVTATSTDDFYAPSIISQGNGWASGSGTSSTFYMRQQLRTLAGTNVSGRYVFSFGNNLASLTDIFTINSSGVISVAGATPQVQANVFVGTSFQGTNFTSTATNGTNTINTTNYTAGAVDLTAVRMLTGSVAKTSGTWKGVRIEPTFNQSSATTTNVLFEIDPTVTNVGSGGLTLFNAAVGGASRFRINQDGTTTITRPFATSGSTPSNSAGTGAGTGPTISITGNDIAGYISITTGTSPTASGDIVTITFATALTNTPTSIQLTPANANAATEFTKVYIDQSTVSSSSFKIKNTSSALTASTTYIFYYLVTQ